jgi:hypothetical protein
MSYSYRSRAEDIATRKMKRTIARALMLAVALQRVGTTDIRRLIYGVVDDNKSISNVQLFIKHNTIEQH